MQKSKLSYKHLAIVAVKLESSSSQLLQSTSSAVPPLRRKIGLSSSNNDEKSSATSRCPLFTFHLDALLRTSSRQTEHRSARDGPGSLQPGRPGLGAVSGPPPQLGVPVDQLGRERVAPTVSYTPANQPAVQSSTLDSSIVRAQVIWM